MEELIKTPKYQSLPMQVRGLIERLHARLQVYPSDNINKNLKEWQQSDYLLIYSSKFMVWYKPHINSYKTSQSIGANREMYLSGGYEYLQSI